MPAKQKAKQNWDTGAQIDFEYRLLELPTPFHGAGLIGAKIVIDYCRSSGSFHGKCELTSDTAVFRLSQDDVSALVRAMYLSEVEERGSSLGSPDESGDKGDEGEEDEGEPEAQAEEKSKTPSRSQKQPAKPKKTIVPLVKFISLLDPSGSELPRNLYRKLLWAIRSGAPARKIYENPAAQEKKAQEMWEMLVSPKKQSCPQDIAGHDLLGSQSRTCDRVPMYGGEGRLAFLLPFWTVAAWVYPVICQDSDGALASEGLAVAVPVIGDLKEFAGAYVRASRNASATLKPHYWMKSVPFDSVIPLPRAAAMDSFLCLKREVEELKAARALADGYATEEGVPEVLLATEVYYLARNGRSHQVRDVFRLAPQETVLNRFERARKSYRNPLFLRRLLQNILLGLPWFSHFDREVESLSSKYLSAALSDADDTTVYGKDFFMDANKAFDCEKDPAYIMDVIVCSIAQAYVNKYMEDRADEKSSDAEKRKIKNDGARKAFYQFRHMPLSIFPSKFIEEIGDLPLESYFGKWEDLYSWLSESGLLKECVTDSEEDEVSSPGELGSIVRNHRHIITAQFNMALRKDPAAIKSIWLLALGRTISR